MATQVWFLSHLDPKNEKNQSISASIYLIGFMIKWMAILNNFLKKQFWSVAGAPVYNAFFNLDFCQKMAFEISKWTLYNKMGIKRKLKAWIFRIQ